MPTTGKGKPSLRVVTMQRAAGAEQKESLVEETRAILEEARMVLSGIQALFGFQLIAVFNTRFDELAPLQTIHLITLVAGAVSMSLVMTPAAYHRIAERVGSRLALPNLRHGWLLPRL